MERNRDYEKLKQDIMESKAGLSRSFEQSRQRYGCQANNASQSIINRASLSSKKSFFGDILNVVKHVPPQATSHPVSVSRTPISSPLQRVCSSLQPSRVCGPKLPLGSVATATDSRSRKTVRTRDYSFQDRVSRFARHSTGLAVSLTDGEHLNPAGKNQKYSRYRNDSERSLELRESDSSNDVNIRDRGRSAVSMAVVDELADTSSSVGNATINLAEMKSPFHVNTINSKKHRLPQCESMGPWMHHNEVKHIGYSRNSANTAPGDSKGDVFRQELVGTISVLIRIVQRLQSSVYPAFQQPASFQFQAQTQLSSETEVSEIGKRIRELEKGLVLLEMIIDAKAEATSTLWEKLKRENFTLKAELEGRRQFEDHIPTSANANKLESNFKAEKARLREDFKRLQALYEQDLGRMRLKAEMAERQLAELKLSSLHMESSNSKMNEQLLSPNENSPDNANQLIQRNYAKETDLSTRSFSKIDLTKCGTRWLERSASVQSTPRGRHYFQRKDVFRRDH